MKKSHIAGSMVGTTPSHVEQAFQSKWAGPCNTSAAAEVLGDLQARQEEEGGSQVGAKAQGESRRESQAGAKGQGAARAH